MKKLFNLFMFAITSCMIYAMSPAENPFHFNHYKLTSDSEISAAKLNNPITEKDRIKLTFDGHLQSNGRPMRIFGTNLSEFPKSHAQADFSAKALANQGYNCIRFHHTDANWSNCFIKTLESGKHVLDTKKLDDFDYFFYQLKQNGIYSNINLLTGRSISPQDGYPAEIKGMPWKSLHCYGFWNENARQKQKDWAFDLLSHVNPYTGIAYKDDPAVAIIEVNNENGLLMGYLSGWLDDYNDNLWQELETQWNEWLKTKELSFKTLSAKYNKSASGKTALINSDFKWNLEQHNGAKATIERDGSLHTLNILNNGQDSWHIQYGASKLNIASNKVYTLKFSAKASADCEINVSLNQAHDPWQNAGFSKKITLNSKWQNFEYTMSGLMDDSNLRVIFSSMGFLAGKTIYFDKITFEEGGSIEYVQKGTGFTEGNQKVKLPRYNGYSSLPAEYKNLVLSFLWDKENAYWMEMRDYLRKELNSKALIMGTAMGCSTTMLQSCFDIIDTHAYWNHPSFPVKDWDMSQYYVSNNDLVKTDTNNTLTSLAKYRVYGKPFSVSEYDHPYPNQYTSEMYPMIASFASFQDWDCIFTFCSELPKTADGQKQKINGYFDQSNNPSKSCAAPIASRIFRNYLVSPGKTAVYLPLSTEMEKANLYKNHAWSIGNPENYGMNASLSLCYRFGITIDGKVPKNAILHSALSEVKLPPKNTAFTDTKEIYWDEKTGVFIVCNDNVTITILHSPNSVIPELPTEWNKEGRVLPLKDVSDFVCMACVKEDNKYLVFGCSWVGNKGEGLRVYGTKENSRDFQICRDNLKLSTLSTLGRAPVYALSTSGTFEIGGGKKRTLYKCDLTGNRSDSGKKGKTFTMEPASGTLWYVIE